MHSPQEDTPLTTIMVLGEGLTDIGCKRGGPSPKKTQGVVCILTHRLCGSSSKLKVRGVPFPHMQSPGKNKLETKINFFLKQNVKPDDNTAGGVLFFDSDGGAEQTRTKRKKLAQLRDKFAEDCPKPVAIGIAQPMIEAWLLTDPDALKEVKEGDLSKELPQDPESHDDVKRALADLLEKQKNDLSAKVKWEIAKKCSIEKLREKCPIGFVPFEEEVQERLKPLLLSG